ncbi:MAG: tyrosine-type recombinase/integrase [Eubacteriaceae bacterium]|jgi:integrase/recombinase XerC|nr:tyrosine-type recombinase/integrase [Eubacteriaceae bacterium]
MSNYSKNISRQLNSKLNEILADLPDFVRMFFVGIDATTAIKTRIAYATDLRTFFTYLIDESILPNTKSVDAITLKQIDDLDSMFIERYLAYLSQYKKPNDDTVYTNSNSAKARKLSSIRSMYRYFYKKGAIKNNPSLLVDMPKKKEKPIVRLEVEESADLLDSIESGEHLSKTQKRYHNKTSVRDLAIITLMLGTGIRISECVGLDIADINFSDSSFRVTRKGGNDEILYFGEEVKEALEDYLKLRNKIIALPGEESALFLSLQKKRMQVSSVQKMLKKYIDGAVPLKNISPHKLRSTFGTNLYRETGDIYLVADVLGHKDVNTTRKHYAAGSEELRKAAAKNIKLR